VKGESGAVAVGVWEDGRLGIARASSAGSHGYGFTAWRENDLEMTAIDTAGIYPALLTEIKTFAVTGKPPIDPEECVAVVAFMEAANESMGMNGAPAPVRQ